VAGWTLLTSLGFTMLTSLIQGSHLFFLTLIILRHIRTMLVDLVSEKQNGYKDLLYLHGMNKFTYGFSFLLWHVSFSIFLIIVYIINCTIFVDVGNLYNNAFEILP
jgi:hypothetical protein